MRRLRNGRGVVIEVGDEFATTLDPADWTEAAEPVEEPVEPVKEPVEAEQPAEAPSADGDEAVEPAKGAPTGTGVFAEPSRRRQAKK